MKITAAMVKELREKTAAPMLDCKKALTETDGDIEKAIDYLRKKGLAAAKKKASRTAAEGVVGSYIHAGGQIGVLVELNCETDFVARTDDFQELAREIAMHIAASEPRFALREEVTEDVLAREREIYREQVLAEGKPEKIVDKIVNGKMEKFFSENVLTEQKFIKNPDQTVADYIAEKVAKIGENIRVRRFARFKVGEGIEKRVDDFAAEVAAQAAAAAQG